MVADPRAAPVSESEDEAPESAWRRASTKKKSRKSTKKDVFAARNKAVTITRDREGLEKLLGQHVMYDLSEDDCRLLWDSRERLVRDPRALPKFLLTVNWGSHDAVREGYRLLKEWAPMPPLEALQLLSLRFPDPKVRAFAV